MLVYLQIFNPTRQLLAEFRSQSKKPDDLCGGEQKQAEILGAKGNDEMAKDYSNSSCAVASSLPFLTRKIFRVCSLPWELKIQEIQLFWVKNCFFPWIQNSCPTKIGKSWCKYCTSKLQNTKLNGTDSMAITLLKRPFKAILPKWKSKPEKVKHHKTLQGILAADTLGASGQAPFLAANMHRLCGRHFQHDKSINKTSVEMYRNGHCQQKC